MVVALAPPAVYPRRVTVPYPGKPVPEPLPQFRGTAGVRQSTEQRRALLEFVARVSTASDFEIYLRENA